MANIVRVGTRRSPLARRQTTLVTSLLEAAWPGLQCRSHLFTTEGDRRLNQPLPEIGGKGLFTSEIEAALRSGEIDIAVHSLKDLPVDNAPGLVLGAIAGRADVRDALVTADGRDLAALPAGTIVGTSSRRRSAQLLAVRPDLVVRSIRGNVGTRVHKVLRGVYGAAILAMAGLERLGLTGHIGEVLPLALMLPAPGQGALAVQCRAGDERTLRWLAAIDDPVAREATTAERAFLHAFGGGCAAPVAAYARQSSAGWLHLQGLVTTLDGRQAIRVAGTAPVGQGCRLGRTLADQARQKGAKALLLEGQRG